MIGLKRKRHLLGAEKLKRFLLSAESTFQESFSKKAITQVQEQTKGMSPRHSAYIPPSVKSPLMSYKKHLNERFYQNSN